MPFVTSHMSVSLDGFCAGPDQSLDQPLGAGGLRLHRWHIGEIDPLDQPWVDRLMGERGAYVMGRNMFGPVRGEWGDSDWEGWWLRARRPRPPRTPVPP